MSDTSTAGAAGAMDQLPKRPFKFNGNGREYFGIWIVNILLSIVTLGIYSAWAKVRTKRYFNGNTELDGHRFDYHANPVAILKGRIIVVVVLVVMNLLSQLNPILALGVLAFYIVALPWVIIRGLAFNANMTSYRNIRFHFKGRKRDAFVAVVIWPILAILTLGLLAPFASRAIVRFLGNGHSFGTAGFMADPPLKPYYAALVLAGLVAILPFIILIAALYGIAALQWPVFLVQFLGVVAYFGIGVAFLLYAARSRNIGISSLKLEGGHRFGSNISARSYIWIIATNFLLSVITLGIYIPWAQVRLARYLADHTTMYPSGDLGEFTDTMTDDKGVTSGEFLDLEGFDFGF